MFFKTAHSINDQRCCIAGITTVKFGDTSYQNRYLEKERSAELASIFSAQIYHKLEVQHKDHIVVLNQRSYLPNNYHSADALICFGERRNELLISNTADCPIIVLSDRTQNCLALIHSGWASCRLNIVNKTLNIINEVGFEMGDIEAYVWPGIDRSNYYFGQDIGADFGEFYYNGRLDLKGVINKQLLSGGLLPHHINIPQISSAEKLFFSYRLRKEKERNAVFAKNNHCYHI